MKVVVLETSHPTEVNNASKQLGNIGLKGNSNLCLL
jgi:hypothetical protein